MFKLKGKVAIVTGAARGIGQAIAFGLAENGADIVVSDIIPGDETVNLIKKMKRKAIYVRTDISNKKDAENLIATTIKNFKKIDILVNNAGIFRPGETLKVTEEEWEKTIDVNLKGCFFCSQAALRFMKKGASIVNISSIAGIGGYAQAAAYCASKGGIRLLTKSLAAEFGAAGIRVNSIHPGVIETEMTKDILSNAQTKEGILAKVALKRAGKPEDIAGAAVFLASDASSYMTGSEIVIDGGWVACL